MNKKVQLSLVLVLVFFLGGCNDGITSQDRAFISKVKEHLKEKGDIVKVADIHPGDWEKVCFQPMSAYAELAEPDENINRRRSSTWSDDDRWGIYFRYVGNKVEYYRISRKEIYNNGVNSEDGMACIARNYAFFEVESSTKEWNEKIRVAKAAGTWNGKSFEKNSDFIKLRLIHKEN